MCLSVFWSDTRSPWFSRSSPGVYVTEFEFVPRSASRARQDEDDGALVSILYNATRDASFFGAADSTRTNRNPVKTRMDGRPLVQQ